MRLLAASAGFVLAPLARLRARASILALFVALLWSAPSWATGGNLSLASPVVGGRPSDAEQCLSCHRFAGLSRLDKDSGELRLFFADERFYAHRDGPHSRLACTDCHTRAEVERVPHETVTPVDCTQTCHVVSGSGAEALFSHDDVEANLELSVHGDGVMGDLPFEVQPLREGQAQCLYCHDDPVFRDVDFADESHRGFDATTRCRTCHTEELNVDVNYFLHHTAGRLQAARPVKQLAEVCATCHSNEKFNEEMDRHDAVTSYFRSFHGKASLLGSTQTATCLDCHQTETGDVHQMRSSSDEASNTNEANLALTCRSAQCHPNAAPQMTAAAVHMRADPLSGTPEYYVTAAFVILTVSVMTIYFALVVLELFHIAFLPVPREHRELIALAKKVNQHPLGQKKLLRLSPHQRVQHWLLVLNFFVLVATGMQLKFASWPAMQHVSDLFGGIFGARNWHRVTGVLLLLTFVYHLGYLTVLLVKNVRHRMAEDPSRGFIRHLVQAVWESPMMVQPKDVKQFAQLFLYLVGLRKERPAHGRYHFSQKFEYWAVFWGMAIIGSSGIALWTASWVSEYIGGRALNYMIIVHSDEAFLALIYIAVVHFFAVIFSPTVFPLSTGSLTGFMPVAEVAEAHSGHLREVAAELGITVEYEPPKLSFKRGVRSFFRRTYAAALLLGTAWLGYTSLGFLIHELSGPEAVVAIEELPLRLTEENLALTSADDGNGVGSGGARHERYQRGPLAHFHVIPTWYSPDPDNTCWGAGCHEALPHGERKEDRAFLNMHSTFVDCMVCHLEDPVTTADLTWVTLDARDAAEPPAVVQLASLLANPQPVDLPELQRQHDELVRLLTVAVEQSSGDPELRRWLANVETARVDGPLHTIHVEEIRHGIVLHGHGEYGEKIGLANTSSRRWVMDAEQQAAAEVLREPEGLSAAQREAKAEIVHRGLKKPEVQCTRCHDDEPELLDFEALGYGRGRAEELRANNIARQSEAVERGEVFYLPTLFQLSSAAAEEPVEEGAEGAEGAEGGEER